MCVRANETPPSHDFILDTFNTRPLFASSDRMTVAIPPLNQTLHYTHNDLYADAGRPHPLRMCDLLTDYRAIYLLLLVLVLCVLLNVLLVCNLRYAHALKYITFEIHNI